MLSCQKQENFWVKDATQGHTHMAHTHTCVIFVYHTSTTPVVLPKAKLLVFFFFLNLKRRGEKHGEGPPHTPHKGSHGGRGGGKSGVGGRRRDQSAIHFTSPLGLK